MVVDFLNQTSKWYLWIHGWPWSGKEMLAWLSAKYFKDI